MHSSLFNTIAVALGKYNFSGKRREEIVLARAHIGHSYISPGADSHKVSDYTVSTTGGMHYVWMFVYVFDTLLIHKNSGRLFIAGSFDPKKIVQILGVNA